MVEDEAEKMRRFIFEEFMKKGPDEISFEKPDSGSGIGGGGEEEEESGESSSGGEEGISEEEDIQMVKEIRKRS